MLKLTYISSLIPEKVTLAEESWRVCSPFLCHYQWASDDPSHSPRAVEIASAIMNRGKKGACTFFRPEGYRYILPVLHPRHFKDAINNHRKMYYVSFGGMVLLYFDIDLHYAWQTLADGQDAKWRLDALLRKFFGGNVLFWSPSSRGFNGYLKVDLKGLSYALANELFDRLEAALRLFLASCKNMADFEIKGTIGHMEDGKYRWGRYGKLPIHSPDWSFAKLEEFKATPPVSIHRLASLCGMIEAQVSQEELDRHKEIKRSKGDEPFRIGDRFLVTPAIEKLLLHEYGETWRCKFSLLWGSDDDTWLHERHYRNGKLLTDVDLREQKASDKEQAAPSPIARSQPAIAQETTTLPRATRSPCKVNLDLSDLMDEPDSFKRQKEAMRRFARYLKRVPTLEEGMQLLHDHRLFTGSWDQNLTKRKIRVRGILGFIAETFDPSKCANGHVNVGKYDEWARKKFPNGLVGGYRKVMDEFGNITEVAQNIHISTEFIAVFMAVVEFALIIDKNQDNSVPHDRCKELWIALKAKGLIGVCFDDRKWPVCRDELAKLCIIAITDRNFGPDKAMKWALAPFFPFLGLWKTKRQPSLLGPSLLREKREKTTERHNTFLQSQAGDDAVLGCLSRSRPPP